MTEERPDLEELAAMADELRAQGPRGRYAPSPTGPLHLGNVRTALLAWLQTRLAGGTFVMRMEDLDRQRTVEGSAEQILDDLRWLGLDWDEGPDVGGPCGPYDQSDRDPIYDAALELLDDSDLVFRCYCSRREIREASSAPHGRTAVYPGTCRFLTPDEEEAVRIDKDDKTPSWRFRVADVDVTFEDLVMGAQSQRLPEEVGDFPVRRADGLFAYQLAVVVDDWLMGITDVLRGEDLVHSTPRQIALFEAFGAPVPSFWHVPLMMDGEGRRMSKRDGSESLEELREKGASPDEVVGQLAASFGWVDPGAKLSADELLQIEPDLAGLHSASTET